MHKNQEHPSVCIKTSYFFFAYGDYLKALDPHFVPGKVKADIVAVCDSNCAEEYVNFRKELDELQRCGISDDHATLRRGLQIINKMVGYFNNNVIGHLLNTLEELESGKPHEFEEEATRQYLLQKNDINKHLAGYAQTADQMKALQLGIIDLLKAAGVDTRAKAR